jgi:hypothetical protein
MVNFNCNQKMKKQFAIRTLKRIKAIQQTHRKLKALGVDLIDYENGVDLLEESVALLFAKDEKNFKTALDDVQWWLYEDVDKIITLDDKSKVDVSTPEAFIDCLERWYDVV